jgi:hypothetical protein
MFVFGEPERPAQAARVWWVVGGLLVLAFITFAAVRWFAEDGKSTGYVCAFVEGDDGAEELCHRRAEDLSRRAAIEHPGPVGYDGTAEIMQSALAPIFPGAERPATEADVTAAREALARAGLPDSLVRVAQADDPAPDGALVFALQMGDGCVVGYREIGSARGRHDVGGLLPNGRCLA